MGKPAEHNTEKTIISSIATAIGLILVLMKTYSYIGIILLSFGSLILLYYLGARKREITSDEFYRPNFFETYIALGIVLLATTGARVAGEYNYGKVNKKIGF